LKGKLAEGPPDEDSHWAEFVFVAGKLLGELTVIRNIFEKSKVGEPKGMVMRIANTEEDKIVRKILDRATELHCTSGKVGCSVSHSVKTLSDQVLSRSIRMNN
jgi:hypothetical protein